LKAYFYFNKIPYHQKIKLVIRKLSYGAREWWFEFLDFRTRISIPLILSWQDLKQSLILRFIQDDYKKILYRVHKQLDCYYLSFVQPSKIASKKIMEELSSLQSKQFQYHNSDNNNIVANINLIVDVLSTNTEEEIKKLLN
jgi:hypothetical protein